MLNTVFCVHSSAYEEGKFCETFHLNASGWRCCESCGKVREIFSFCWPVLQNSRPSSVEVSSADMR